jgi:hypothetical protein
MATSKRKPDPAPEPAARAVEVIPAPPPAPEAGNVVTLYERPPASPLDLPAEVFRAGLDRRKANRAALMEWVRAALVEGADFGRIHTAGKQKCQLASWGRAHDCQEPSHWSKPSLWKPGAEKICGMLGVTVHYPTLAEYEKAALAGSALAAIILRCELHDGQGHVVAEGIGARNVQQDYGDLNKALKMAGKSAHIDATLRMAGLSEVFTQDLEDLRPAEPAPPKPEAPPAEPAPRETISANDHRRLEATIRDFGLDRERVKAWVQKSCKVEHFPDLSPAQFERLLVKLKQWHDDEAERLAYEKAQADDARIDDADADPCPF